MKQTRRLINGLVASAVAFAMVSSLAAETEGTAKVIRIKGPARFTTGNNVWQPLKAGAVLSPGTILQTSTEQGSYVDLALDGGATAVSSPSAVAYKPAIPNSMDQRVKTQSSAAQNVVRVWENTALGIDKLGKTETGAEEVTDTQLDLKAGRISGSVKKLSPASKYEVKLPNGVAGIRGSVYDITANGLVRVLVGSVVLAWVNPKDGNTPTQVVMGGQQFDARTGQMTAIPSSEISSFDTLFASMSGGPTTISVSTYVADKTVIPVSPVGASRPSSSETPFVNASGPVAQ